MAAPPPPPTKYGPRRPSALQAKTAPRPATPPPPTKYGLVRPSPSQGALRAPALQRQLRPGAPATIQPMRQFLVESAMKVASKFTSLLTRKSVKPMITHEAWEMRNLTFEKKKMLQNELGSYNRHTKTIGLSQDLTKTERALVSGHESTHHASAYLYEESQSEAEEFCTMLTDELVANYREMLNAENKKIGKNDVSENYWKKFEWFRNNRVDFVKRVGEVYALKYAPKFPNLTKKMREEIRDQAVSEYLALMNLK